MDTFLGNFTAPTTKEDVIKMLGDQSAKNHHVFRDQAGQEEFLKTICVGIFDLKKRTWSLYKDNPKTNEPLVEIPLVIKN
jgi:hypothetical protein